MIELYQTYWQPNDLDEDIELGLDIPCYSTQVVEVLAAMKHSKDDEFVKQKLQDDIEVFVEMFDTPEEAITALQQKGLDA